MSKIALNGFYRLTVEPRLDGTARYVLYHLAFRHNEREDAAYPSIDGIMRDLDLTHGTVHAAIGRLERARLIRRVRGGDRSRTTRYQLPWLRTHLLNPDSKEPIVWKHTKGSSVLDSSKRSNVLDRSSTETVRSDKRNHPVGQRKSVQSAGHENNKTSKRSIEKQDSDWRTAREACLEAVNLSGPRFSKRDNIVLPAGSERK